MASATSDTLPITPPLRSSRRERVWVSLAALTLVALAGGFWYANGTRTFGELMVGAFSWCF